jgi:hypothetical protein
MRIAYIVSARYSCRRNRSTALAKPLVLKLCLIFFTPHANGCIATGLARLFHKPGPATARSSSNRRGNLERSQPGAMVVDRPVPAEPAPNPPHQLTRAHKLVAKRQAGFEGAITAAPPPYPPHCYTSPMFRLLLVGEAGLVVAVSAFYLVRAVSVRHTEGGWS